jgi:hypothetical protein
MTGGRRTAGIKWTSVLRRVPPLPTIQPVPARGREGDVCAFRLAAEASPIVVEDVCGRAMTLVPGDVFLATPGFRDSTRWAAGGIPKAGLASGRNYWLLADSGVIGDLTGTGHLAQGYVQRVEYLGSICREDGQALNIRHFAAPLSAHPADHGAPVYLVLGTSAEVGKTTAAISVLRALLHQRHRSVVALKATGTSSFSELATYQDFGAAHAFDCVDFGLPTTYPSDRHGIARVFERALDLSLSIPADAVIMECGGDMLGANVPSFLKALKRRRRDAKVILVAADAMGALGGKRMLNKMGFAVTLIAGPCTDTPTLQRRTERLCRTPTMNMAGK